MPSRQAVQRVAATVVAAVVAGVVSTVAAVPAGAVPTPTSPVPGTPALMTPFANINAAYNKAVNNLKENVTSDGKFNAGERWQQAWVRDTSYSSDLGANLVYPQVAKATLLSLIEKAAVADKPKPVWVQNFAGHFGSWPGQTDAIVGAVGSWSIFLADGDKGFLSTAYQATENTLQRAETDVWDRNTGLFKGCASFDDSKSAYPASYWDPKNNPPDSAGNKTEALSTNAVYYRSYVLAAKMAAVLGKPQSDIDAYNKRAADLKAAINKRLWNADHGVYASYLDESGHPSDRIEGLGESLAILWGVATPTQAAKIRTNVPKTKNYPGAAIPGFPTAGIPTVWPQYPEWLTSMPDLKGVDDSTHDTSNYYHDGMVWPFVQSYWAIAAAAQSDTNAYASEMNRLLKLSGISMNYVYADQSKSTDNSFHEFYRPDGSVDGSARQLWSAAGYLGMVYHGLFGMTLTENGIQFSPVLPAAFNGTSSTLNGVKYRGATLNITVHGAGTAIKEFKLDGKGGGTPVVPTDLTGTHIIDITMAGSRTGPVHAAEGQCIDVRNADTANGTPIQLYSCNGTPAQQITVVSDSTLRVLGKCIDVKSGGRTDHTPVWLYQCNGTGAQQWVPQTNGSLRNPQSGRCLDASAQATETQLQIYVCKANDAAQRWRIP